jgi:hypothetical protein
MDTVQKHIYSNGDKAVRMTHVLQHLHWSFQSILNHEELQSIDEKMITFKAILC